MTSPWHARLRGATSARFVLLALALATAWLPPFGGAVCAANADPAAAEPVAGDGRFFPYDYQVKVLPNGLTCILIPLENPDLVAYVTVVRTGSRDEVEPGHSGFAHFFEHMMFRGTEKISAAEYNRMHVEMGADDNAFTSDDLTCYHLVFSKEHLEEVIAAEADRFMHLSYSEQAFQKEASTILGEYNKSAADPGFQLEEKFFETAFQSHTYGHTTMGFLRDVEGMPNQYEYSLQFFDRFYRPDNCIVLVVGDIDPDETLALVNEHYGAWQGKAYRPSYPVEPEQKEERFCHVDYAGASLPMLWLGYKAPAFDPARRDFAALSLLADLSFGETSALFKDLVLEKQWVEWISADLSPHRDPHLFFIAAQIKPGIEIGAVQARIEQAIAEAVATPIDPARLEAMKSNMRYAFLSRLDSTRGTAMSLLSTIQLTGGIEALETKFRTLASITPAEIQDAARTYLVPERRTVGTLTGSEQ